MYEEVLAFISEVGKTREKTVEVTGPNNKTVVVHRGMDRETYNCTPDCSRRLTLGDMPEYFDKTTAEIVVRNN
jgi:hypothetical protein